MGSVEVSLKADANATTAVQIRRHESDWVTTRTERAAVQTYSIVSRIITHNQ
jgi:hypothetical protein